MHFLLKHEREICPCVRPYLNLWKGSVAVGYQTTTVMAICPRFVHLYLSKHQFQLPFVILFACILHLQVYVCQVSYKHAIILRVNLSFRPTQIHTHSVILVCHFTWKIFYLAVFYLSFLVLFLQNLKVQAYVLTLKQPCHHVVNCMVVIGAYMYWDCECIGVSVQVIRYFDWHIWWLLKKPF